ncbi:transposase, partial [archaeon]
MRARAVRDDVGVDAVGAASAPAGRGLTSSSTPRKLAADDAVGSSTPTASSGTADARGAYDVAPGRTVRTGGSASTSLRAHANAAPSAGGGSAVAPAHAHEDDDDSITLLQEGSRLEVGAESVRGDDHRLGVRRTAGCGAVVAAGAIVLLTALALIRLHAGHADTVLVHDPALVADAAGARDVWKPFCGACACVRAHATASMRARACPPARACTSAPACCSRDRVARLMKANKIQAKMHKHFKKTTQPSDKPYHRGQDLVQQNFTKISLSN